MYINSGKCVDNKKDQLSIWFFGWGLMLPYISNAAKRLQVISLESRKFSECRSRRRDEINYKSHLCVGGDLFEGLCTGDSGSPGFVYIDGKVVAFGVVSRVVPCGSGRFEDVITRLSSYKEFLSDNDPEIKFIKLE